MASMNRIGFIGASDVAAIIGLSKFKTPYDLFLEKTGQKEQDPENLYMAVGTALEDVVLDRWAKRTGGKLMGKPRYVHPEHPWLAAALDSEAEMPDGELVVVEAKTCSFAKRDSGWGAAGSDLVPGGYFVQVQMQMLCARANGRDVKRAFIPALFLNRLSENESQPQIFEVAFAPEMAAGLLQRTIAFWECVSRREWPHKEAA
jgi:putative phage-type endonuclease